MLYNGTLYLSVLVVLKQAVRFYVYVVAQMRRIKTGHFDVYENTMYGRKKVKSSEKDMLEALPRYARNYCSYLSLTQKEMEELILESL